MGIHFNQQQTDLLFPFHLKVSTDGMLIGYGKTIKKILPDIRLTAFNDYFQILEKQEEGIIPFIETHLHQLVKISIKANNHIHLRGQFVFSQTDHFYVFLGSPAFNSIKELEASNLDANDFAIQNPQIDLLNTLKTKEEEEAIRNNYEQKLLFALEKMGDNVWLHDYKKNETHFFHNKKAFIKIENNQLSIADQWWKAVHPEDVPLLIEQDRKYKNKEIDHHSAEYRIRDKFGNYKWILDRGIVTEQDEKGFP